MKRLTLYFTTIILAATLLACHRESGPAVEPGGGLKVRFTLDLPADAVQDGFTKAMTAPQEGEIQTLDVYSFLDYNSAGTYRLLSVQAARSDGSGGYDVTLDAYPGKTQKFVLVANASGTFARKNDAYDDVLAALTLEYDGQDVWTTDGTGRKPIPMVGYHQQEITVSTTQFSSPVGILRMLARFDVTNIAPNFEVVSASVFNRKTKGQIAYKAADFDGSKVSRPWIPAGNINKYWDENYIAATAGSIVRALYTFEAGGIPASGDRLAATAIVVGGKYDNGPVTYYRVDVKVDGSGSTGISEDIKRNHLYAIEVQSCTGPGETTPEDAFKGPSKLNAVVKAYDLARQNIIIDGQYILELSADRLSFGNEGGSPVVTMTTNYDGKNSDGSTSSHPAGIFVTDSNQPAWITLTTDADAALDTEDGLMTRKVKVCAAPNTGTGALARTAEFTVRAGNLNYTVRIGQSPDPWLEYDREELYMLDGDIKNFEVRSAVRWTAELIDPDGIVRALGRFQGGGNTGWQEVPFRVIDDWNINLKDNVEHFTVRFTDDTGLLTKDVEIPCISGNTNDIPAVKSNSYMIVPRSARGLLIPVDRANDVPELGEAVPAMTKIRSRFLWADDIEGNQMMDLYGAVRSRYTRTGTERAAGYLFVKTDDTGNGVIAITTQDASNADVIRWSWHIWVKPVVNYNTERWMDRNLGANSNTPYLSGNVFDINQWAETVGLFYQWGRKDPFPGFGYCTQPGVMKTMLPSTPGPMDLPATVREPMKYPYGASGWYGSDGSDVKKSWDNGQANPLDYKTIYDPCPPGWCMPKLDDWYMGSWTLPLVDMGATCNFGGYYPAPGAGSQSGVSSSPVTFGKYGFYWSASVNTVQPETSSDGWRFNDIDGATGTSGSSRSVAFNVRCIKSRNNASTGDDGTFDPPAKW